MGCRNEEGSSSLNAIVPVHDFAQHKIISMKKKTCVPSPKSYLVSSNIEVEQNMSWIPYYSKTRLLRLRYKITLIMK